MSDPEASPLLPDEAPAENSIEGEPLRMETSGPASCRASASCLVRRDGSRRPRAGVAPPGPEAPSNSNSSARLERAARLS
jgi:hypothetical protein